MYNNYKISLIIVISFVCIYYYLNTDIENETDINEIYKHFNKDIKYLIDTPTCRIENIDPYNKEVRPFFWKKKKYECSKYPLLTYVSRDSGFPLLHINKSLLNTYSYFDIICCYSEIYRNNSGSLPDETISVSDCHTFNDTVALTHDVIEVKCTNFLQTVYENVHYVIPDPDKPSETSDEKINILIIGIDGMSKLNFIRTMPRTYSYCESNGWIALNGYNKIEDNTYPNLMALLTGRDYLNTYNSCSPFEIGHLDTCNFIWKEYKKFNYTTAFGEDSAISTFNFLKKGFLYPPTDIYLKPYVTATLALPTSRYCSTAYCTGPENGGQRILDIVEDFTEIYKDQATFSFFWMNSFSHDDINCATTMDDEVLKTLSYIENVGIPNNTIILLLSDHGFRYGKIRTTQTGYMEERLPLIYFWIPDIFKSKHAIEYQYLLTNTKRLVSPYDLYMSFQHILQMQDESYEIKNSLACPTCKSIFAPINEHRTCHDAGIPHYYCTCTQYYSTDKNDPLMKEIADYVTKELNNVVQSYGDEAKHCSVYTLDSILNVKYLMIQQNVEENVLIKIKTFPEALFEVTVNVKYNKNRETTLSLVDKISRIDRYGPRSYCAKESKVQYYCYCQSFFMTVTRVFCNHVFCIL